MRKLLLAGVTMVAASTGLAHAAPITLMADGLTYTLTETGVVGLTASFDLNITGINGPADVSGPDGGGRSGVNAIAFTPPSNFVSATMTNPAGYNFTPGGLNSSGCNTTGNFFCFANQNTPGSTPALPPGSTLDFLFTETISSGSFAGYTTDLKIDWVGNKNNYDLVSMNLPVNVTGGPPPPPPPPPPPVPEPASLLLLGVGLVGLGVARQLRK
jgi:hypothetical protein